MRPVHTYLGATKAGHHPWTDPNILFILSDQHSKFHLGCYGDPLVRTPHLDRLASEGMRFANAYTPSPLCVPARMAFMTGRRPSANQVWGNDHILNSALPTWAHMPWARLDTRPR